MFGLLVLFIIIFFHMVCMYTKFSPFQTPSRISVGKHNEFPGYHYMSVRGTPTTGSVDHQKARECFSKLVYLTYFSGKKSEVWDNQEHHIYYVGIGNYPMSTRERYAEGNDSDLSVACKADTSTPGQHTKPSLAAEILHKRKCALERFDIQKVQLKRAYLRAPRLTAWVTKLDSDIVSKPLQVPT